MNQILKSLISMTMIFGFTSLALAENSQTQTTHGWFCTASGYDSLPLPPNEPGNGFGQLRTVNGPTRKTEAAARTAAVNTCVSLGWQACQAGSCFNL